MSASGKFSRRLFLECLAAAPFFRVGNRRIPVGLELYSVRDQLQKDLMGTVRQVARMGYECVEFYAPYYDWTLEFAKRVRGELDDLGVRCYSTHNPRESFEPDGIPKAIELNQALGARYIVLAHPGDVTDLEGWRRAVDLLNGANDRMVRHGLHAGYHNHELEWIPVAGQKPIELIAAKTDPSIMLQLDVGTCLETGNDPVAWVRANPGRIRSMHCKDWSPERGYRVLFGQGVAPWRKLFAAAESTGGIEYYLIEQEESDFPELEAAARCLGAFRKLRQ
ncbi:MAG TPA: sugar phosphate isomerase/epimerase [Candidatus Cybelea sp.]|nr:sugar phosphate isomerase/epimerase [Candidatus Cybelea sp.]